MVGNGAHGSGEQSTEPEEAPLSPTLLTVLTVFSEMNASGLLCFRLGLHD